MSCTICGGDLEYLGLLGRLEIHRCQNCGMTQSRPMDYREPEGEGDPCGDRLCDECELDCPLFE
jgi:hypothetical protein